MFRKLVLPAACAVLLGGCVSYGYSDGGYYYGQPSVRYYGGASYGYPYSSYPYSRYYGGRYGSGYGYPYGGYGYGGYGGYGYGYGGGYGYPYYPYYPRPRPPHDHDDDDDGNNGNNGNGKPPWRRAMVTGGDAQRLRDNIQRQNGMRMSTPSQREAAVQRPAPRAEMPMRPAVERRAMPERRMSAPSPRNNVRERDVGREETP